MESIEPAIWIVDDDQDDQDLVKEIFEENGFPYPIAFFATGKELLAALEKSNKAPFIIISDVNLPRMNGFQLREKLLEKANSKFHSVPFIFWSNTASEAQIEEAFRLRCHGFFIKEPRFEEWKVSFVHIIEYWRRSRTPSRTDKPDPPQS